MAERQTTKERKKALFLIFGQEALSFHFVLCLQMISNEPWSCSMDDSDDSKQGEEKDKKKEKEDQKECFIKKLILS